jgi:very-short-patch-repair endonuclease
MTRAERVLWSELRRKNLEGVRFRRQFPLGDYIADFVCLSARLIIELDGEPHLQLGRQIYDRRRTEWLNRQGFRVMRFQNDEVVGDLDALLAKIAKEIRDRRGASSIGVEQAAALPLPPPEEGGGG